MAYSTGPSGAEVSSAVGGNDTGAPQTPSGATPVADYTVNIGDGNQPTTVGHVTGDPSGPITSGA